LFISRGFSTVSLVTEAGSDRLYALKKIQCHGKEDELLAIKEIECHRQIRHPSVIECVASSVIGSADISNNETSFVLLLLPYFKAGSLHALLERRQLAKEYFSDKLILNYFLQVCEGLEAVHQCGLAHRDLKPANILLAPNERIIIMDLGSAAPSKVEIKTYNEAQRLQDDAAERCSMTYRAPEFFNIPSPFCIDERTDIWSLGCLLYAMCFFKSPFDDVYERGDSVALAVSSGVIHYPEHSSLNPSLMDLISKMLIVDTQQRPFIAEVIQSVKSIKLTNS